MKSHFLYVFGLLCLVSFATMKSNNLNQKDFQREHKTPEVVGKLITEDLLARDFRIYRSDSHTSVHYAEVCVAFGAARLAGILKDTSTINRLSERYMKVIDDGIKNTEDHVDVNVYGILPLELYKQNKNDKFFEQGLHLADKQWEETLPNGITKQVRYWIDDIWMIGSLQVQAYRVSGNEIYLNRAANTIYEYLKRLQQPNGLFFHGEDAHFFWGRGNGWVAAGLAELLSELPESNQHYVFIRDSYKKMMTALLQHQADDGMWRQLIDNKESWKETSSTAMFGYAFTVGIRNGVLEKEKYEPASTKAWESIKKQLTEDGKVKNVCEGTGKSSEVNHYLTRERITGDLHGQAAVMWFAYSRLIDKINLAK